MDHTNDTLVALGRLEGKLDVLVTMHGQQSVRIDALEARTNSNEIAIAGITATAAQSRDWTATGISIVAAIAAVAAIAVPYFFGAA